VRHLAKLRPLRSSQAFSIIQQDIRCIKEQEALFNQQLRNAKHMVPDTIDKRVKGWPLVCVMNS